MSFCKILGNEYHARTQKERFHLNGCRKLPLTKIYKQILALKVLFGNSWLVCLLGLWLRNAPLVKIIGSPISDGIVYVFRGGHWDFRFCGFGYFLDRFFGFCCKRLRFVGFGGHCGLRIFRFLCKLLVIMNLQSTFNNDSENTNFLIVIPSQEIIFTKLQNFCYI